MASAELEELIARHFEGDLDAAGEARLDELLAADPEAFERFKGLVGVEGLLRARAAEGDARDELEDRVSESVRLEERRRRLTSRVMESLHERRARALRPTRSPAGWWAAGVAAAVFLGVLAIVATRPGPAPRVEREEARSEPEPVAVPRPEPPKPRPPERIPEPPVKAPEPRPEAPVAPPEPPPVPAPKPEEPPAPAPAPRLEVPKTVVAVADVPAAEGAVFVVERGEKKPLDSKQLLAGQAIETGAGRAVLQWTDGTRAELGAGTEVREVLDREPAAAGRKARGRRLVLARGALTLSVARQPADQAMVVTTPQGEARVIGTAFRVTIAKGATQLEVTEGKVRFTRGKDGKSVDVGAGQALVVGAEPEFSVKPLQPDEIVLHARDGRPVGEEWKLVADRRASLGWALESQATTAALAEHPSKRPSYVEFSFWAAAGREYRVWVRGASQPTGDPWTRDMLVLASAGAEWNHKCRFFGTSGEIAYMTAGYSKFSGFGWVSGFVETPGAEPAPLTLKFAASGPQTFRLYASHPSIRVDAVWLSATQLSKPGVKQLPPPADK